MLFIFKMLSILLVTADNVLVLTSFAKSDCTQQFSGKQIMVKLGVCLNNHDFTQVSCDVLNKCLAGSGKMYYGDLVTCTGAPAMFLSVNVTVDSKRQIAANIHSPMTDCSSLGFTTHYSQGDCASTFALAPKCGLAGVRVNTTSV